MTKRKLWMALAGVVLLLAGLLAYVKEFKPITVFIPVADIDRLGRASGLTDCFWISNTSEKSGSNYAYPDTGANYWLSQFKLPAGAQLELDGDFPHARHMSFNTYDDQGQPVDRLNDVMLATPSGATNPFQPQADRRARQRSFSLHILAADVQAGITMAERDKARPVNTLYAPAESPTVQLIYRIYVPDQGLTPKAGVELPRPALVLANGQRLQGDALCQAIVVKEKSVRDIHLTLNATQQLLALKSQTSPFHPAQPQPQWTAFQNAPKTFATILTGTSFEWITRFISTARRGGFYSTIDNTYMSSYVDTRLGDTLVLQARAPSTPRTLGGAAAMGAGQLRYWSVCKYRSLYDTAMDSCAYDEQVPLDAQGNYTLVFSTPDMRPGNAREECGVAWRPWGVGDGIDNPHGGMLVLRHMLPAPDFTQSLFATQGNGDEEKVLGPYFPRSHYEAKTAFEQRGCPVRS